MSKWRRCQARHGQKLHLQCEGASSEEAPHVEDHWAVDRATGKTVHWLDLVAMYPAVDEPVVPDARLNQIGGGHYSKHKIQPWDIWQEYKLDAFTGAVIKYLLRDKGNRLEDLRKARHTLDRMIELEEGK